MMYKGKGGIKYNLENTPFAQGGEGRVYNIIGEPKKVAKLYKNGLNDVQKERKLLVMVSNPPNQNVMSQIAWPLDVLYDVSNTFVGFVMPKLAINEDLNVIYEYGSASKYPNIPWSNKIVIAKNLCAVLDAVHEAGHVVGDFNPKNISVDPNTGHIVFVDTDSYHIEDNGTVYRCNVGVPEYLSVEIQTKLKGGLSLSDAPLPTFSKASDNFALAVHIFQLLMNSSHPFACRVLPNQASVVFPQPTDNILNGLFPFMQSNTGIDIPVYAPPITILPKELQDLFRKAFIDGHTNPSQRPSPEDWYNALTKLERNLSHCNKVAHHEYFNGMSLCPWCEVDNKFKNGLSTAPKTKMTQSTTKQVMKPAYTPSPPPSYRQPQSPSNYSRPVPISKGTQTKSKRIIFIIIAAIILSIVGINAIVNSVNSSSRKKQGEETIYLSNPTSLRVANGTIVWDAVQNASSYVVKINGKEYPVSFNSFTPDSSLEAGSYEVSVKAQGSTVNVIASNYSETMRIVKPQTTDHLIVSDGILSWDAVSEYEQYRIVCDGLIIDTVNSTTYSITNNISKFNGGVNNISVIVAGDSHSVVDSNMSVSTTITKLNQPLNVSVANDTLTWQNISGAIGYKINITGKSTKMINVDSNINSCYLLGELEKGNYQINVQAIGDNLTVFNSEPSSNCSYALSETVIKISTKEDLINIANNLSAKYILQNDIDLSGENWIPIGSIASRFEGVLLGNGYSIIGLNLTSQNTQGSGFFAVVGESGKISNIKFVDVKLSGGTTGYIGAVAGINYGDVFDITVSGHVGEKNSGDNVGGLIGKNYGSLYNCVNRADVMGASNVGGIAGTFEFNSSNMTFTNCSNEGTINGQTRVGGIAGYIRVSRLSYISKLQNSGQITAKGNYGGGICGYVEGISGQTGNFESCVNEGNIQAGDYAGGCFGYVGTYINITTTYPADITKECSNAGEFITTIGNHKGSIRGN